MKRTLTFIFFVILTLALLSSCGGDECQKEIPAGTHEMGFTEVLVAATCEIGGTNLYTCKHCGQTQQKATPPLSHDLKVVRTEVIDKTTYVIKECQRQGCERQIIDEIIMDTDSDSNLKNDNDSNASDDTNNDTSTETEISGEECLHDWRFLSTSATCTESGVSFFSCSICLDIKTERGMPLGHDMKLKESVNSTCVVAGYDIFECSRGCGATEHRNEKPLSEAHTWEISNINLPSCTKNGSIIFKCSVCFDENYCSYQKLANGTIEEQALAETIKSLGHDFSVLDTEHCLENGYKVYSCSRGCGATETRIEND